MAIYRQSELVEVLAMRVYFYDLETGIFQGEEYEYDEKARHMDGATTIAPPPYERGTVPVYNREGRCWTLKRLLERDYYDCRHLGDVPALLRVGPDIER